MLILSYFWFGFVDSMFGISKVEMGFVDCGGRPVKKKRKTKRKKKRKTKKKDRVERLMKRAEQGKEKRWRRHANCKGRAEMRDEGRERTE